MDSEDDELEAAVDRYIFNRKFRTAAQKREQRKERAKMAGVGFGSARNLDSRGDMDLVTTVDVPTRNISANKTEDAGGDYVDKLYCFILFFVTSILYSLLFIFLLF